ncbi:beta-glucoside-specific PTS transporter subunit IIABC [Corynebacterium sp. H128]|uniref:beta-glucoside-specific PTS transporter subunit IIABC n=1 Tax=Corynebacterium sp. H128 TaxID=3133427 RepID=UPI00309F3837
MVTKQDFAPLAQSVLDAIGGPDNVRTFTHCATRLRFKVADPRRVDESAVSDISGVLSLVKAGGQHQVVIGNDVPLAYQALATLPGMAAKATKDSSATPAADSGPKSKNPLNAFMDLISALFTPLVWCLAGLGLGKAFLGLATNFGWLAADSDTYLVFNACFDAFFYFLPIFIADTAARKFKVNTYIAMATVAPLVYPAIVAFSERSDVQLFGIPVSAASYTSSVIAPIFAVWLAGFLQRGLERLLPGALRNFLTPLIVVAVMVPVVLLTIGPATVWASQTIADGINYLFVHAPWLGGAVMGAFWQVLVIFGLHWAFVPVFLNELAIDGHSFMLGALMAPVLAQAAAALAVFLRTKNQNRKKVAGAGVISGFLAGVTEPIVYGVNLPLKLPFYAGCLGGAVGGAIIAMGGNAMNSFVFPSLMALPAAMHYGSFNAQLLGSGVAILIAFIGSWVLTPSAERQHEMAATAVETHVAPTTNTISAPIDGRLIPLDQVPDKVFASGAMGEGAAIEPTGGGVINVIAPITGTVLAAPKSGHAYGIKGNNGVEVLVHLGIDTVQLRGEGFNIGVDKGAVVTAGQVIGTADLDVIRQAGYQATTMLIVTNSKKLTKVSPRTSGTASAGEQLIDIEL